MTDDILRETRKSSQLKDDEVGSESIPKKPRTSEDFYLFCKFILEYENYDVKKEEEHEKVPERKSKERKKEAKSSSSNSSDESQNILVESADEDSYDLVTCFCNKPFAGRPMIECSTCRTWIHLRCAKVRKSKIPDVYICTGCKRKEVV